MEKEASPSDAFHLFLFLLLSALLLFSAAHLIESICYSIGLVDARPLSQQDSIAQSARSKTLLTYRFAIALSSLFLAYHCLGLKNWSRKGLVGILAIDLVFWLVWSVRVYLSGASLANSPTRLGGQVLAVALECGLVWILTHPEAIRHFVAEPKKGRILPT